jgi:hypothetical protein
MIAAIMLVAAGGLSLAVTGILWGVNRMLGGRK